MLIPRPRLQCRRTLQAAVLEHLVPLDAPGAAHQLVTLWPPPEGSPPTRKGTGVLLGCATPAVCDRLFGPLKRQLENGPCASCVLHVTVSRPATLMSSVATIAPPLTAPHVTCAAHS